MTLRCYSDILKIDSFEKRYEYLRIPALVGDSTFGSHRWLNQDFYRSKYWKQIRSKVILRDEGCDLGIIDRPILDRVIVHHMNPVTEQDIIDMSEVVYDPEYLICVSNTTHQAIHYGDSSLLTPSKHIERKPFDTVPWKKGAE